MEIEWEDLCPQDGLEMHQAQSIARTLNAAIKWYEANNARYHRHLWHSEEDDLGFAIEDMISRRRRGDG